MHVLINDIEFRYDTSLRRIGVPTVEVEATARVELNPVDGFMIETSISLNRDEIADIHRVVERAAERLRDALVAGA